MQAFTSIAKSCVRATASRSAAAIVLSSLCIASFASAQTPPPQPAFPAFGSTGQCGIKLVGGLDGVVNAAFPEKPPAYDGDLSADPSGRRIWAVIPTGTSATPQMGGTCDDTHRPVIVIAHGLAVCGTYDYHSNPLQQYGDLVVNLVSHGFIVVYPNFCLDPTKLSAGLLGNGGTSYDMVDQGFIQAASKTGLLSEAGLRMDLTHIGFWGHSYGGSMVPWLAEQAWARRLTDPTRGWAMASLWIATSAPYKILRGGNPYKLPSYTRSLHMLYSHDQICDQLKQIPLVGPIIDKYLCDIDGWNAAIYNRLPTVPEQKWSFKINSDCSHSSASDCPHKTVASGCDGLPHFDESLLADHYTPAYADDTCYDGFKRTAPSALKYYGTYRNLQAIAQCARNRSTAPECLSNNLTYLFRFANMGTWSDSVAATTINFCGATCP